MAYNNAPFNYYGESPNQVLEDLTKANENFTILGTAFISNDPGTGTVKNSDKVDGYHASQTPTPNTIPVSDSTGRLSLNWMPQSVQDAVVENGVIDNLVLSVLTSYADLLHYIYLLQQRNEELQDQISKLYEETRTLKSKLGGIA